MKAKAVNIKTADEIELMRESGALLAQVFAMLDDFIVSGITTLDIDTRVEDFIVNTLKARPASKGQYGYKFTLNSSVNEVVCHGVPNSHKSLKPSDIVNIDITLEKNGFIADSSNDLLTVSHRRDFNQRLFLSTAGAKTVRYVFKRRNIFNRYD